MHTALKFLRTPRTRAAGFAVLLVLLFALYIGLILISDTVSSDVLYEGTMLPELLEWGYQGVELVAFFVSYALILRALFDGGLRGGAVYIGITVGASVLRFAVLMAMMFIGGWAVVINLIPELIQLALIVWICYRSVAAFDRIFRVKSEGARALERSLCRDAEVYPQKKQPIASDPLLRAARGSAVCVSVIRVLGRLVFDVTVGPPTDLVDALWMLCYYSVDVLIGVGGYYLMKWILHILGKYSMGTIA